MSVKRKTWRVVVCLVAGAALLCVLIVVYIAAPRVAMSWPEAVRAAVAVAAVVWVLTVVARTTVEVGARELHLMRPTGQSWTLSVRMAIALAHFAEWFTMRRWPSRLETHYDPPDDLLSMNTALVVQRRLMDARVDGARVTVNRRREDQVTVQVEFSTPPSDDVSAVVRIVVAGLFMRYRVPVEVHVH